MHLPVSGTRVRPLAFHGTRPRLRRAHRPHFPRFLSTPHNGRIARHMGNRTQTTHSSAPQADHRRGPASDGAPPSYSPPEGSSSSARPPTQTALVDFAEYHVYKDGRLFGRDDIITGADKQVMLSVDPPP